MISDTKAEEHGSTKRPTRAVASGPPTDVTRGPPKTEQGLPGPPVMTSGRAGDLSAPTWSWMIVTGLLRGRGGPGVSGSYYSVSTIITSRFPHLGFQL